MNTKILELKIGCTDALKAARQNAITMGDAGLKEAEEKIAEAEKALDRAAAALDEIPTFKEPDLPSITGDCGSSSEDRQQLEDMLKKGGV